MLNKRFFILFCTITLALTSCNSKPAATADKSSQQENASEIVNKETEKLIEFLTGFGWISKFSPSFDNMTVNGILRLENDGTARYEEGSGYGSIERHHAIWHGTYKIEPKSEATNIIIDLKRVWQKDWGVNNYPETIKGVYSVSKTSDLLLSIELIDGVALFRDGETRKAKSSYEFETYNISEDQRTAWDMSDAELLEHVITEFYGSIERLEEGRTIIVPGNITDFDGLCRDVWVGIYQDGKFVREEQFTVLPDKDGSVFKNYSSDDYNEWYYVGKPRPFLLALKFGEEMDDGWWQVSGCQVDLQEAPVGYLLYDKEFGVQYEKVKDRVNVNVWGDGDLWMDGYQVSEPLECYLWVKDPKNSSKKILKKVESIKEIKKEIIGNRHDDMIIANILTNEEIIYYISEIYIDMEN